MENIIIKSKEDIALLKKGDHYIIDGPDDPEEFFAFLQEIKPLIESHVKEICAEPAQPIHADPEKDKLIRKFIRHYEENPNNVHSKFQEIDLLDIMYCLDIEGDDRLTKKREVELIVEELTRRNIIAP